jgi:hypothetical protein
MVRNIFLPDTKHCNIKKNFSSMVLRNVPLANYEYTGCIAIICILILRGLYVFSVFTPPPPRPRRPLCLNKRETGLWPRNMLFSVG